MFILIIQDLFGAVVSSNDSRSSNLINNWVPNSKQYHEENVGPFKLLKIYKRTPTLTHHYFFLSFCVSKNENLELVYLIWVVLHLCCCSSFIFYHGLHNGGKLAIIMAGKQPVIVAAPDR